MCDHEYLFEDGFKICQNCGASEPYIDNTFETTAYEQLHCPLQSTYNRSKRFNILLRNLLYPCPCHGDEHMLRYFIENKLTPKVEDIVTTMQNSALVDKRYNSMHLFAQMFSPDYVYRPIENVLEIEKILAIKFREFEYAYFRKFKRNLSYSLVLHHLLSDTKLEYLLQYVKTTKCKKRWKEYRKDIQQLNFTM